MKAQGFERPFSHSMKEWLMAARPKTLTAAVIPIAVGTCFAHGVVKIHWGIAAFALLVLLCIQIGMNITNDALDIKKGADTRERVGPVRITQRGLLNGHLSHQQVLGIGFFFFFLALLFGMPLIAEGGIPVLVVLLVGISFGYLYTGGPFPLAYTGLADLFVLIFYGWIGVAISYYLQAGKIDAIIFLAGTQVGLLATIMLAINNLRDRTQDAKASKKTLAVRFGDNFARIEITFLILTPFMLNLLWLLYAKTLLAILPFIAFPMALKLVIGLWNKNSLPNYNQLFGFGSLLTFSFGFLLCLGVILS